MPPKKQPARGKVTDILNFYKLIPKDELHQQRTYPNYDEVRIKIPMNACLAGRKGTGKSNTLMNLWLAMSCFTQVYLFVRNPGEDLYAFLIKYVRSIEDELGIEMLHISSDLEELPPIESFDPEHNNLVVIDDMIGESKSKLNELSEYFTRGRRANISPIFVSQSYFAVPIMIRKNLDVIIFKKLDKKDLSRVLSEYSMDKSVEDLLAMYKKCKASDIDSFFMIDTSATDARYQYRCGFLPIE